jgi:hypothetical protein
MIIIPCLNCYTAVRVMGEPDVVHSLVGNQSEFWPSKFTCISCGNSCEGMLESEVEAAVLFKMKVRELTAEEMYAAQHGLGTPDEMVCNGSMVRELFSKSVKKVHGYDITGTTRYCIDHLEFEDGTKLYLGASPSGAIVYRIARPISYTQKVLEESNG